jgi:hypothetical protein
MYDARDLQVTPYPVRDLVFGLMPHPDNQTDLKYQSGLGRNNGCLSVSDMFEGDAS